MKRKLRHLVYWTVVVLTFIPAVQLILAAAAYEYFDAGMTVIMHWAYQEHYVPKARKPGDL